MRFLRATAFDPGRAWASDLLADFGDATVRLHWTDAPYRWHANTGPEVFAVIDGEVDMLFIQDGEQRSRRLRAGDIATFAEGDEHLAVPRGQARILVVERPDSD